MNYCIECGTELKNNQAFCPECGTNQQNQNTQPTSQTPNTRATQKSTEKTTKKPLSKKSKIIMAAVAVLLIGIFSTHKIISANYDPIDKLKVMDRAITNGDSAALFTQITYDEKALLDKEKYTKHLNQIGWDSIRDQLHQSFQAPPKDSFDQTIHDPSGDKLFVLKGEEKFLGLYTEYIIEAVPSTLHVVTNTNDTKIELAGKEYDVQNANEPFEIGKAYPGQYPITGKLSNEFGEIIINEDVSIGSEGDKAQEVRIDFPLERYYAYTNAQGSVLYINGKSTGKTLEEYEFLGPFPVDEEVEMFVEWTAANGDKVQSETLTQYDGGWSGLYFSIDEDAMAATTPQEFHGANEDEAAGESVLAFRSAYETALNTRDYSEIEGYMLPDSHADEELREYIGKLKDENYTYEFTENTILSIEKVEEGIYEVTTNEQFIFTNHEGKQTEYDREKVYTVVVEDGNYLIEKIDIHDTDRDEV